jgi:hypothetical protein
VDDDAGGAAEEVAVGLFEGMEACVLGLDSARVEACQLLKAGGAVLMTSKNTLDDGVKLFSCDTTNARFRRYAALDAPERPDIMNSRLGVTSFSCSLLALQSHTRAATSQSVLPRTDYSSLSPNITS